MFPASIGWGLGGAADGEHPIADANETVVLLAGAFSHPDPPPPIEPVVTDGEWTDGTEEPATPEPPDAPTPDPQPDPEPALPPGMSADSPRDDRLLSRAVRQGWPIPPEYVEAVIRRQVVIAANPKAKARDATRAFQALVNATRADASAVAVQINAQVAAQRAQAARGDDFPPLAAPGVPDAIPRVLLYLPENGREAR